MACEYERDITIVPASPYRADVTALITALDEHLNSQYPPEHTHLLDITSLAQPNIFMLVAEVGGTAIGCGAFRRCEGYAEIKRMYVKPAYRGLQIGRRILLSLEVQIKTEGYLAIRLETGQRQLEAIHLYDALGYRQTKPFGEYLNDPCSLCYEKLL